ncbi:WD40-repeat-containing domain protein [Mycena metata]|uniref:WD40-repeat-containing domain protein n=1 Tax=Mycena metata TaxID=1033252 RepID=A0AAD7MWH2_9AGAR|nr:WD40-repeat-containing domain protein [Mycena metata]
MSGSAIYNHRTLQPTGSAHGHTRLSDALEVVKHEYEAVATELVQARTLRDEYEAKVTSQINELNIIRQALYELEAQHGKVRQRYEDEIGHLRAELHALRQLPGVQGIQQQHTMGPGVHPPDGYRNGIGERYPERDRERERERERERGGERDPKRLKIKGAEHFSPLLPPVQAAGLNGHGPAESPRVRGLGLVGGPGGVGERVAERERGPGAIDSPRPHRDHPHLPQPRVASGNAPLLAPERERDREPPPPLFRDRSERDVAMRDVAALREREASIVRDRDVVMADDRDEPAHPAFLDLDPTSVPPEMKKEGGDWFAIFNPRVRPRVLGDVSLVHTLVHTTVVCCVQFSADGRYLATGCNRSAQIYDVKTGTKTCVLVDESAGNSGDLYIRSVRFSPDGRFLATGAEDRQVRIWEIAKKRIRSVFSGHTQEIYSLDFSRDGRRIVSGSGDRTARIWDMETGACTVLAVDADSMGVGPGPAAAAANGGAAGGAEGSAASGDAGVTSVAISPDGRYVAAGSLDTIVRIWDAQTGALVERLRGHRDSVYSVVFTPDGLGVVSGSLDKTLKYWDVSGLGATKTKKEAGVAVKDTTGDKCTMNFKGHKDYVLSVAVSHDGQWIVSGSKDRGVQFWDRTGVVHSMLQGHKNSVISIDLNPTGNLLATGSGDNLARIWSYATA